MPSPCSEADASSISAALLRLPWVIVAENEPSSDAARSWALLPLALSCISMCRSPPASPGKAACRASSASGMPGAMQRQADRQVPASIASALNRISIGPPGKANRSGLICSRPSASCNPRSTSRQTCRPKVRRSDARAKAQTSCRAAWPRAAACSGTPARPGRGVWRPAAPGPPRMQPATRQCRAGSRAAGHRASCATRARWSHRRLRRVRGRTA